MYDHAAEVKKLSENMQLWNAFFKTKGIKILWSDTFNTHAYPIPVDNMSGNSCLLNRMLTNYTKTSDNYHLSSWKIDDDRVSLGVEQGLLNPISFHPTIQGHQKMSEILSPFIESFLT